MEGSRISPDIAGSVLDSLEEQVAIIDGKGAITQVNEAWKQWAVADRSLAASASVGSSYLELLRAAAAANDRDAADLSAGLESVLDGSTVLFEHEYMRQRDDRVRWFASRVTRLRTNEGGAVVSHYEITDRKRAEQERESHRYELGRAVRAATLGQLSGALAHELNQPLTAILANAQAAYAALGAAAPEEQGQILSDIVEDARRAGQVIQRLRNLLQHHAAKFDVVDLNRITEEVLALSRSELLLRNVELIKSFWQAPLIVHGDTIELQHLLLNLIVNACEAMASTHPRQRTLQVCTSLEQSGRVRVVIADSGPGIELGARDRIFEPFYTTKKHGLGLGLSICRSIAAIHNGRIIATNGASGGAEVAVELPAAPAAAGSIKSRRAPHRIEAELPASEPSRRESRRSQ